MVKGWAAERAAAPLRALPGTDFCLSAGGDIVCRTLDPDGPPWRIGVEDPRDPRRLVAVVPLGTGAVATSGSAHRGQHVVDARTGRPPIGIASVTVVAASLTDADIDATAAYAQGPDAALVARCPARPERPRGLGRRDDDDRPRRRAPAADHALTGRRSHRARGQTTLR